jgi:hypothetical protein
MRLAAWLVVGACYGPHPPAGVACADNGDCPSGLHCVALTNTCEVTDPQPGADASTDGADGRADAPPDSAAAIDCWPAWRTGSPVFSTPTLEQELSTANDDVHPWLSADGLTVFYASGTGANQHIFTSTRPKRDQPFGAPTESVDLSSGTQDPGVAFDATGLVAIIATARAGGKGTIDLWEATRVSTALPFGTPAHPPLANVDSTAIDIDPHLSDDGLRLYYALEAAAETLELATRPDLATPFSAPAVLAVTGAIDANTMTNPRLSPDELTMAYADNNAGDGDIYIATRASLGDSFTMAGRASISATGPDDQGIGISADGCAVVFASNRPGVGSFDLYSASVSP